MYVASFLLLWVFFALFLISVVDVQCRTYFCCMLFLSTFLFIQNVFIGMFLYSSFFQVLLVLPCLPSHMICAALVAAEAGS